jgi:hypothetical protein
MNQQSVVMLALFTLIASAALAAGSYYFVGPALNPVLERPVAPSVPQTADETADRNLLAVSLQRIQGVDQEFEARETSRNPFQWPVDEDLLRLAMFEPLEEDEPAAAPEPEPEPERPGHELKMVLIGEMGKVAFINRVMLAEGDSIDDYEVTRINPLDVVLRGPDNEEYTLTMEQAPNMIAQGPPRRTRAAASAREQGAVPAEDDLAGQREYLMDEVQTMQGAGI